MVQRIQIMPKIAVTIILKGEMARQCTAGIFYALPSNTYSVTPVWKLNGSTALEVIVNRSVALFFFATNRTIFSGMTIAENTCLKGNNSTQQATDAHETGFATLIEISLNLILLTDIDTVKKHLETMFLDWVSDTEGLTHDMAHEMTWSYRDMKEILDMVASLEQLKDYIHAAKYPVPSSNPRIGTIPNLTIVN